MLTKKKTKKNCYIFQYLYFLKLKLVSTAISNILTKICCCLLEALESPLFKQSCGKIFQSIILKGNQRPKSD